MPRLSGRDTLRRLREINPRLLALFSSGYSAEQANLSAEPGVVGFVTKPYYPQDSSKGSATCWTNKSPTESEAVGALGM